MKRFLFSAAVLLGVMFADRTPAILNYTAGDAVMQSMYDRAKLKTVITSRLFLARLKKPVRDEMIFLEDLPKLVTKGDKLLTAAQIIFFPEMSFTGFSMQVSVTGEADGGRDPGGSISVDLWRDGV